MIRVRKSPEPDSLKPARRQMDEHIARVDSSWQVNLGKEGSTLAFQEDVANKILTINLSDDAYRPPEAKARLVLDHYGKCAFCESRIYATAVGDIEHFRPKGGYNEFDPTSETGWSKRSAQGYFWLAYTWDNHVLSCKMCNSEFKGNFAFLMPDMDSQAPSAMTKRLSWHDSPGTVEFPILLNPADPKDPDPRTEINFDPTSGLAIGGVLDDKGRFIAVSHRGGATIRYMGLNRPDLVFARANHLLLLRAVFVEMARDLHQTMAFLKWQRGANWAEEARQSIKVSSVWGQPDLNGLSDKRREQEHQRFLSSLPRPNSLKPLSFSFPNMQIAPTDEAVPAVGFVKQPDDSPTFSQKAEVWIPDNPMIENDARSSPLQFLRYSVSARAAYSGLARDALGAWSLELAEALISKSEFASQLDRPDTSSPIPVRSTAEVRPFSIHPLIWNYYLRDQRVLCEYEKKWKVAHAIFAAQADVRSLEFICRKILLNRVAGDHKMLGDMAAKGRPSQDYFVLFYKHFKDLDEIERTLALYNVPPSTWKEAVKTMNENLDNHPPDIDRYLNATIKRYNELVDRFFNDGHLPAYAKEWKEVSGAVEQLGPVYLNLDVEDETEKLKKIRVGLDTMPPDHAADLTGRLNTLIDAYTTLMAKVNRRNDDGYVNPWQSVETERARLLAEYESRGIIDTRTQVLVLMNNNLTRFCPDKTFIPGTPQAPFDAFLPFVLPDKQDFVPVDPPEQSQWKTPKPSIIQSKTEYLGKGQEEGVWQRIRIDALFPSPA